MGRGKHESSLKIIDAAYKILEEIRPAGVRAVCYRLFVEYKLLKNMGKGETNKVSSQLRWARENDMIPWEWIVDGSREAERPATFKDPQSFVEVARHSWRRDAWQFQPVRLELWSEKNTVKGTTDPVLREYGVEFQPVHGYGSATVVHDTALESLEDDSRPLKILYIGDYDPSGLHMSEKDLPGRLAKYGGKVEIIRVALTDLDIGPQHYAGGRVEFLPSFPLSEKKKDPRHDWYADYTGLSQCWELDALNPIHLRSRLEEAIRIEIMDKESWERTNTCLEAERDSLEHYMKLWNKSISRLERK